MSSTPENPATLESLLPPDRLHLLEEAILSGEDIPPDLLTRVAALQAIDIATMGRTYASEFIKDLFTLTRIDEETQIARKQRILDAYFLTTPTDNAPIP